MILQQSSFDDFAVGVPAVLALATLLLCGLYYRNRSHEYGNLLISAQQQGVAVCAALALMWTIQYAIGRNVAGVFLPILLGSVLTTLLCVIFASVGDTWYAVGSGQFQMVSLDTAALLGYVVAPLVVLISIACEKYGQQVSQAMTGFVKSSFSDNVHWCSSSRTNHDFWSLSASWSGHHDWHSIGQRTVSFGSLLVVKSLHARTAKHKTHCTVS